MEPHDFEEKLYAEMDKKGFYFDDVIDWSAPGIQRLRAKNSRRRGKPLFISIHHNGASFGDWREPKTWTTWWYKSWKEISLDEKKARLIQTERIATEKRLLHNHAIWRSELLLSHRSYLGPTCSDASPDHPYVLAKRIIPYYALQIRSSLVIRAIDIDGKLRSLQFIKPNGRKQFKKNASAKEAFALLGEPLNQETETVWLCEGWATGCTIKEVTQAPVVCALTAANIPAIAIQLRRRFIHTNIRIAADNDQWTDKNIGLDYAQLAAEKTGARVYAPTFDAISHNCKPTDFNDLYCLKGFEEVEAQLGVHL